MTKVPKWVVIAVLPLALYGQSPQRKPNLEVIQVRRPTPPAQLALALGPPAPMPVRPAALQGPTLAIDKYVVAGGGGTSTGGGFSLDGTIGQAAAGGPLAAGSFSLTSGFWEPATTVMNTKRKGGQLTSQ